MCLYHTIPRHCAASLFYFGSSTDHLTMHQFKMIDDQAHVTIANTTAYADSDADADTDGGADRWRASRRSGAPLQAVTSREMLSELSMLCSLR